MKQFSCPPIAILETDPRIIQVGTASFPANSSYGGVLYANSIVQLDEEQPDTNYRVIAIATRKDGSGGIQKQPTIFVSDQTTKQFTLQLTDGESWGANYFWAYYMVIR